jgi:uncharacterized protein with HEPN domain
MKPFISNLDKNIIESIIDSIVKIISYTGKINNFDEFYNDNQIFDASIMNFIVIGEMVARLSDELKHNIDYIDWINIVGFRNILAHDYFGIDAEEVFQIIKADLPLLKQQMLDIIEK